MTISRCFFIFLVLTITTCYGKNLPHILKQLKNLEDYQASIKSYQASKKELDKIFKNLSVTPSVKYDLDNKAWSLNTYISWPLSSSDLINKKIKQENVKLAKLKMDSILKENLKSLLKLAAHLALLENETLPLKEDIKLAKLLKKEILTKLKLKSASKFELSKVDLDILNSEEKLLNTKEAITQNVLEQFFLTKSSYTLQTKEYILKTVHSTTEKGIINTIFHPSTPENILQSVLQRKIYILQSSQLKKMDLSSTFSFTRSKGKFFKSRALSVSYPWLQSNSYTSKSLIFESEYYRLYTNYQKQKLITLSKKLLSKFKTQLKLYSIAKQRVEKSQVVFEKAKILYRTGKLSIQDLLREKLNLLNYKLKAKEALYNIQITLIEAIFELHPLKEVVKLVDKIFSIKFRTTKI